MKPQLHKLTFSAETSFLYRKWDCDYFDKPWHFHHEYELVLITKGRGTKFIGDYVGNFDEGDLTLIGSNIPHLFKNDEDYYLNNQLLKASSVFIHFTSDFLGKDFFDIPEMVLVRNLLDKSSLALQINGKTKAGAQAGLLRMCDERPDKRLLGLLEILVDLSQSREMTSLLSSGFNVNNNGDNEKINMVFEFILANYTRNIYLEEIASRLNMSVPSFSRYFKQHTQRTFSDYLTEIRIGRACRLLIEGDCSSSEICFQSGFENLSNFYRHFKRIKGVSPIEYRSRFRNAT